MKMQIIPVMKDRCFEKELMDDPRADTGKLQRTIRQFRILNVLFSSSRRLIRNHFFSIMAGDPSREYTLLDIGAGGCDIDAWVIREARRLGLRVSITALDSDRRILPVSLKTAKDFPEIKVVTGSALELNKKDQYDFVFSNHFLHHLDWAQIGKVLDYAVNSCRAFLFNDIKRSGLAFIGYSIFTGLFLHGSFALYDGRLSIRRGFKTDELERFIAGQFPDSDSGVRIRVGEAWPSRIVITGKRP